MVQIHLPPPYLNLVISMISKKDKKSKLLGLKLRKQINQELHLSRNKTFTHLHIEEFLDCGYPKPLVQNILQRLCRRGVLKRPHSSLFTLI